MTYQEVYEKLEKYGQTHLLKYYDELSSDEQAGLLAQIEATDLSVVDACHHIGEDRKGRITPLAAMQLQEIEAHREEYTGLGLEAIRAGKVGAVLLAGGMGTRLGSDDPKGMYNIG